MTDVGTSAGAVLQSTIEVIITDVGASVGAVLQCQFGVLDSGSVRKAQNRTSQ